ncbi:hypothetical protein DM02DRAFT_12851 [Periconia macrospinosa]|uniref:Zn(2)-C6 fungal-type domain-containing protein n=1 Tax=Periconia macrospinosa TaxID=97972 RepID=A0A2V1EA83_9PLEO|nr:hypothetical protein DM02DRAFT_12851 [Periconia macrospinosa]
MMIKEAMAEERPRKRAKHTRSKLGCRVCRIRRVRCDVTQPACTKCTSTGRKCEWYPTPPATQECSSPPKSCLVRHRLLSSSSWNDPLERRFFDYFRNNTVYHLTGSIKNDFWLTTLLQIGEDEPCIHYGIVAVGGLHEAFQDEHFGNSRLFPHETELGYLAWLYYIKAIEHLNTHIRFESWRGVDIALLCCILCASFERLRGCYTTAETHLRSGLAILDRWLQGERNLDRSGNTVVSASSTRSSLIRHNLVPIFSRLVSQARTFIATPIPCTALLVSEHNFTPPPYLKVARDELWEVLSESNTDCHPLGPSQPYSEKTKHAKHAKIVNKLSRWYDTHSPSLTDTTPDSVSLLISYTLITIMVHTSLSNDQMQFDAFNNEFSLIVNLANILSSFRTVSIEVVPVLLYVALKCRDPLTRRKAVLLIESCSGRELPWDSDATARIAQEVVRIEEEGVECVRDSSEVVQGMRIDRLYSWSDLYKRDSEVRFRRQGDRAWSGERLVTW